MSKIETIGNAYPLEVMLDNVAEKVPELKAGIFIGLRKEDGQARFWMSGLTHRQMAYLAMALDDYVKKMLFPGRYQ